MMLDRYDRLVIDLDTLEEFIRDLADNGLRADLNPTIMNTTTTYMELTNYLKGLDGGLRERAKKILEEVNS